MSAADRLQSYRHTEVSQTDNHQSHLNRTTRQTIRKKPTISGQLSCDPSQYLNNPLSGTTPTDVLTGNSSYVIFSAHAVKITPQNRQKRPQNKDSKY